jgi:hypothetical protein
MRPYECGPQPRGIVRIRRVEGLPGIRPALLPVGARDHCDDREHRRQRMADF